MHRIDLTPEQVQKFRNFLNGAMTVLAPHLKPGDAISLTHEQLRMIAGGLGTEGTAHEVKSYVVLERDKWAAEPHRLDFLNRLLEVVLEEIERFEFYTDKGLQHQVPYPSHVKVLNGLTGRSDREMPIQEFFDRLRAVSASSVFKK